MCQTGRRDLVALENHIRDIDCQIALQRDLVESLQRTNCDASRAMLGLAMLLAMHGQAVLARDAALRATIPSTPFSSNQHDP